MFKNAAELTEDDFDFEPSEPKKRKLPLKTTLSQPVIVAEKKKSNKDHAISATQGVFLKRSLPHCHSGDDYSAFTILMKEADLEDDELKSYYYPISEIRKSAESNTEHNEKIPITVCSIVSLSSVHGDTILTLKDKTGVIDACVQRSLTRSVQPNVLSTRGAAVLIKHVGVLGLRRPKGGLASFVGNSKNYYLNITPKNLVCVYLRPNASSNTTLSENSLCQSIDGTVIRRVFCQPGVNSTSLRSHLKQYLKGLKDAIDSNFGSTAENQQAGNGTFDDDIDIQTLVSVANAFDEEF